MTLSLSLQSLLNIVGASCGLLLSLLLLGIRRRDPLPARLLAALVLVLSARCLAYLVLAAGHSEPVNRLVYAATRPLFIVVGPLIYLYARAEIDPLRGFGRGGVAHLIAPLTIGALCAAWRIIAKPELSGAGRPAELIVLAFNILTMLFFLAYIVLALIAVNRHGVSLRQSYSFGGRVTLSWLRSFLVIALGIWLLNVFLLFPSAPLLWDTALPSSATTQAFLPFILGMAFVFVFAYMGLTQPGLILQELKAEEGLAAKYRDSSLTPEALALLEVKLDESMRERALYLDSELCVATLSELLDASPRHISQVINQAKGVNFFTYVNGFRVEAAKAALASSRGQMSILDIAMDSGFSSKSSFNSVFKELCGMTPTEYRSRSRLGHSL